MSHLALFLRLVAASLRGQLQYPASALLLTVSQRLATGIEVVSIWALFARFGSVQGWGLGEVALFYGLAHGRAALRVDGQLSGTCSTLAGAGRAATLHAPSSNTP